MYLGYNLWTDKPFGNLVSILSLAEYVWLSKICVETFECCAITNGGCVGSPKGSEFQFEGCTLILEGYTSIPKGSVEK